MCPIIYVSVAVPPGELCNGKGSPCSSLVFHGNRGYCNALLTQLKTSEPSFTGKSYDLNATLTVTKDNACLDADEV